MVMVTTQVKEQGFGREGLEAKLQSIELLSEAREKRIGRLRIQIQLSALNDGWVDRFTTSVANHPSLSEIHDDSKDGDDCRRKYTGKWAEFRAGDRHWISLRMGWEE